jgi:hypothetical protein
VLRPTTRSPPLLKSLRVLGTASWPESSTCFTTSSFTPRRRSSSPLPRVSSSMKGPLSRLNLLCTQRETETRPIFASTTSCAPVATASWMRTRLVVMATLRCFLLSVLSLSQETLLKWRLRQALTTKAYSSMIQSCASAQASAGMSSQSTTPLNWRHHDRSPTKCLSEQNRSRMWYPDKPTSILLTKANTFTTASLTPNSTSTKSTRLQ